MSRAPGRGALNPGLEPRKAGFWWRKHSQARESPGVSQRGGQGFTSRGKALRSTWTAWSLGDHSAENVLGAANQTKEADKGRFTWGQEEKKKPLAFLLFPRKCISSLNFSIQFSKSQCKCFLCVCISGQINTQWP